MKSAPDVVSRDVVSNGLVIAGVTVHCVRERIEAERKVALEIADLVRRRPAAVIGLASGSSVVGVYRELVVLHRLGAVDFSRLVTFNLDEYLGLPTDHPASFESWMREHLFSHVNIDPKNTHLPRCTVEGGDALRDARDYERQIADLGGLDLQLLGVGRNGHIGFNEPGSKADSCTRVVELHPWTIADAAATFGGIDRVPTSAITMGVATILAARTIRVFAFGAHKAPVVRRMLREAIGPATPATYLRAHPDVALWIDPASANDLDLASTNRGSSAT